MKTKTKLYNELPAKVKNILLTSEGWLVGNSITNIEEGVPVKDYDILIEDRSKFQDIVKQLYTDYGCSLNTYGGFKFQIGEIQVDIWCESLNHFLLVCRNIKHIFNQKRDLLLSLNN